MTIPERTGEIVSAETIINYVWGDRDTGTRENFNVQILRLRKRIEIDYRSPKLILTVRGSGYILMTKNGGFRDG
ncbi:winged helix-turn-helix domain-containing protein [Ferroacidibacillus organovorans]|uniref:winged helix-turn-helix domain-containing protein n=2 Tax=Ferroacidibacillus organovorans TaxID=1765683 RepID=UPI001365FE33